MLAQKRCSTFPKEGSCGELLMMLIGARFFGGIFAPKNGAGDLRSRCLPLKECCLKGATAGD